MVEFDVYEFAPLDRARHIVAAGPWLGEVGVAMMRWAPYLRALASAGWQVACGGLTGHEPIYEDFAAQYLVHRSLTVTAQYERFRAARQQHTRRQPAVVHWRTSTRRTPDGWRVSKRIFAFSASC